MGQFRFFLFFLIALFIHNALANTDEKKQANLLEEEIKHLEAKLKDAHESLPDSLYDLYSKIVICFERYPKQSRGYPGTFEACLQRSTLNYTSHLVVSVTKQSVTSPRRSDRLSREMEKHFVTKLDAVIRHRTDSEFGVIDLAAKLIDSTEPCSAAETPRAEATSCVENAAWASIEDIRAINGPPGSLNTPDDLAFITRETPNVERTAARFNDVGRYYNMPHEPGLPAGQFYNRNVPVTPPPFSQLLIYNAYISQLLFGTAYFGRYYW